MRTPSPNDYTRNFCFLAGLVAAFTLNAPATADSAPIVYKTPAPSARISAERQTVFITPSTPQQSTGKASARIQFSYPGSTGAETPSASAREYTSGRATSATQGREYASISAPIPLSPQTAPVETVGPKAFDPRAAARKIAEERSTQAVEEAPLDSLLGAQTPTMKEEAEAAAQPTLSASASTSVAKPDTVPVFDESGLAIVYGNEFHGLPTANGEVFDQSALMAAHPNLPLPSLVQVVNIDTNKEVIVRVNDRGPFEDGAMLQVSDRAASVLGMDGAGRSNVRIRYLGPAPVLAPKPRSVDVAQHTATASAAAFDGVSSYKAAGHAEQPSYQPVSFGTYFVQVGAFSQISNAERLINAMPTHMTAQIDPARVNGADFFRVRIGPFTSRDAADRTNQDLSSYGISGGRVVSQN